MKRLISMLVLLVMLTGGAKAETILYSDDVRVVRNAYNAVLDSGADGDAAYNEIYNVIGDLMNALEQKNKREIGYAQVKLFGWEDESTNAELQKKAENLSLFIVGPKEDKLSAIMCKFATMESVEGTIEPTCVDIKVTDMEKFVEELGLCPKATGYVLAMLDIYVWGRDAVVFTENGFTFQWKAIGAYTLDLSSIANLTGLCAKATGYVLAMLDTYVWKRVAVDFTENGFTFQWTTDRSYISDSNSITNLTLPIDNASTPTGGGNKDCSHVYRERVVEEATCTSDGKKQLVCKLCGNKGNTSIISAKGHQWSENDWMSKDAGCEETGIRVFSCLICGEVKRENTPAVGHEWYLVHTREHGCEDGGEKLYFCSRCPEEKIETGLPIGHSYVTERVEEPDCTGYGTAYHYCTNDGCTEWESIWLDPLGHSYQDGECTRCGDVE